MLQVLQRLEAMRQLQVKCSLGWIQRLIQVRFIPWEDKVAIIEAESTYMSKLASKITGIMYHDSAFVDSPKIILNFSIPFEKDY